MTGFIVLLLTINGWHDWTSSKLRIRPEAKQGKFYQSLTEEQKVSLGCCLIPTTGCLIGLYNRFKKDTAKVVQKEPLESLSFWQRLGFGVGYSGGLCWTGKDLRKYTEWTMDPITLIGSNLYWLNSIEISALYKVNENRGIEVGLNYGWAHLKDRFGWDSYFDPPDTSYLDAMVGGGIDCSLKSIHINIGGVPRKGGLIYGVDVGGAVLKTSESLYYKKTNGEWIEAETADVSRFCAGGGFYIGLRTNLSQSISTFFTKVKIAVKPEVASDSPFKWTNATRRITVIFSGLYIGIKFYFGGKNEG